MDFEEPALSAIVSPQELLDCLPVAVLGVVDGIVTYANAIARYLFGSPSLVGVRADTLVESSLPTSRLGFSESEALCHRADGSLLPVLLLAASVPSGGMAVVVAEPSLSLSDASRTLAAEASTDPLTGLANRRRFERVLEAELKRCRRYGRTVSVALLDVDHFKVINDTFGHQAGDRVLVELAQLLRATIRDSDEVGRYGGEEFVIILPETPVALAQRLCERLRRLVQQAPWFEGDCGHVTVTIGVAGLSDEVADASELLARADDALYRGKMAGRNRVIVAA